MTSLNTSSCLNHLIYLSARDYDSEMINGQLVKAVAAYNNLPSMGRQFIQHGFEDKKSFNAICKILTAPPIECKKGRVLWIGAHGNEKGLLCRDWLAVKRETVVHNTFALASSFELIIMDNCRSDRLFKGRYPKGCILITADRDTDWHSSFLVFSKVTEWLYDDSSKARKGLAAPDRLIHGLINDWPRASKDRKQLIQGICNIIESLGIQIIIDGERIEIPK